MSLPPGPSSSALPAATSPWAPPFRSSCSRSWASPPFSSCAACAAAGRRSDERDRRRGTSARAHWEPPAQSPLGTLRFLFLSHPVRDLLPDPALLSAGHGDEDERGDFEPDHESV